MFFRYLCQIIFLFYKESYKKWEKEVSENEKELSKLKEEEESLLQVCAFFTVHFFGIENKNFF